MIAPRVRSGFLGWLGTFCATAIAAGARALDAARMADAKGDRRTALATRFSRLSVLYGRVCGNALSGAVVGSLSGVFDQLASTALRSSFAL